ncbi:MAG: hypothetical protein UDK33_02775 [Prevotella sp.]|nr:hypothetical protein [Prevotella sp.]
MAGAKYVKAKVGILIVGGYGIPAVAINRYNYYWQWQRLLAMAMATAIGYWLWRVCQNSINAG